MTSSDRRTTLLIRGGFANELVSAGVSLGEIVEVAFRAPVSHAESRVGFVVTAITRTRRRGDPTPESEVELTDWETIEGEKLALAAAREELGGLFDVRA